MRDVEEELCSRQLGPTVRWLNAKFLEARRNRLFGEVSITLKFENGEILIREQLVREKLK
jgi:hypothetical protein